MPPEPSQTARSLGQVAGQIEPDVANYSAGQVPDTDPLFTETSDTQIVTQVLPYTLHTIASGNIRPQTISVAEFDR